MRVVIVDDQGSARALLAELVKSAIADADVHAFFDPEDALAWCSAAPPDIALVDYRMQFVDGITFSQRLRAMPGGLRTAIVMVSAQDDAALQHAALDSGAIAYFKKPVNADFRKLLQNLSATLLAQALPPSNTPCDPKTTGASVRALREMAARARSVRPWMQALGPEVNTIARAIGRQLAVGPETMAMLGFASELCDIGMVGVPESVATASEPLSPSDLLQIRKAPEYAYAILSLVNDVLANGVRHAHEHYDGSGYPDGLAGDAIPLISRILAVAGSYCAMVSERPYRAAMPASLALSTIQGHSGTHYDPKVVGALLDALSAERSLFVEEAQTSAPLTGAAPTTP